MAKNDFDFSKAAQDFMSSMKIDTSAFGGGATNATDFNTKLAQIAMDAARQNAELTSAWTQETMQKMGAGSSENPAEITSAAAAFSADQSQDMQEKFAAFVEVAKTAQEKTVELFTSATKEMQADFAQKSKE